MNEELRLGIYRHFKGNKYKVINVATHSETLEKYVVYQALYGDMGIWVRPLKIWNEMVVKDGVSVKRFEYVGEE